MSNHRTLKFSSQYRNSLYIKERPNPLSVSLLFIAPYAFSSLRYQTYLIHETIAFCELAKMETDCVASRYVAVAGEEKA